MPEKPKNDKSEEGAKSRLETIREEKKNENFNPEMPPINLPSHILAYFWEVGPTMPGGMGAVPLSHGEIESWQNNIGIKLSAWECRALKRLSIEYLNESQKATKRECPAPWKSDEAPVISLTSIDTRDAIRKLASL